MMDRHFVIYTHGGTTYRVTPNPDAAAGEGYSSGAVLEWTDDDKKWLGHFFIAPDAFEDLAKVFTELSKEVKV